MTRSPISNRSVLVVVIVIVVVAGSGVDVSAASSGAEPDESTDRSTLLVIAEETGEPLLAIPVQNGTIVTLAYNHSVEKTPVRDVYEVNGSALTMVRMEFDSYGAGLPSHLPVERSDSGTLVAYPNGTYERLAVQPGPIAGHTLEVGDESFDLVSLADGSGISLLIVDCEPVAAEPTSNSASSPPDQFTTVTDNE